MRNLTLHELLEAFTTDAGMRLDLAASEGDEIPFEVVTSEPGRRGRIPLYCYRPLTGDFIRARLGLLGALPTYAPVARALEGVGGLELYLRARGLNGTAEEPRDQVDAVLREFLARVFEERSEFAFDATRFEVGYEELERAIYQGRCVTEVVAPLLGIDLDPGTDELALGEGLSIVRCSTLAGAPAELTATEQATAAAGTAGRPRPPAAPVDLVRAHTLPPPAHGPAPVREGRLRDRTDRLLADRRRRLVAGAARIDRPAAAPDADPARQRGRTARLLQPDLAENRIIRWTRTGQFGRRRGCLGVGEIRDGL